MRNTRSRIPFLLALCLMILLTACRPSSPEQQPGDPGTATSVSSNIPSTETVTPVVNTPSSASELSEEAVLEIVLRSLAQFPWRMEQSVVTKETQQTTTSLTEAQSGTRGYNRSVQAVGTGTVTIESIQVDSMFYLKMTGGPAETYGLVDGQWTQVTPDSSLAQFVDMGAIDPARLAQIFATDFAAISAGNGLDTMTFTFAGTEAVNGIPTTLYEARGENFTYRWWIGPDGRFHKTSVEIPSATRTILMQYDPDITIEPPLP